VPLWFKKRKKFKPLSH